MNEPVIIPEIRPVTLKNHQLLAGLKGGVALCLFLAVAAILAPETLIAKKHFTTGVTLGVTGIVVILIGLCSLLGGLIGQDILKRNHHQGRMVTPASLMNFGLLDGILNGAVICGLCLFVTAAFIDTGATLLAAIGLMSASLCPLFGYMQGKDCKNQMERDYVAAIEQIQQEERQLSRSLADRLAALDQKQKVATDFSNLTGKPASPLAAEVAAPVITAESTVPAPKKERAQENVIFAPDLTRKD